MSRAEKAKEYFQQGYTCSQAVVLAFSDCMSVSQADILKLSLPFGGGMGRLRLTCGAISGMAMVIGAVFAEEGLSSENKKDVYAIVQQLCAAFREENGSLVCGELLTGAHVSTSVGGEAEKRTETYYKKRPCGDLVYCAAELLETYLQECGKIEKTDV